MLEKSIEIAQNPMQNLFVFTTTAVTEINYTHHWRYYVLFYFLYYGYNTPFLFSV